MISLRPLVLTTVCLGALVGCAAHPGPTLAKGEDALPQGGPATSPTPVKLANEVSSPGVGSAAPQTAAPSSSGNSRQTADAGSDDTGSGTDLGFDFDNLEVLNPDLKESLAILRIGSEPKANKVLSVFTGLRNKTGQKLYLEVQTIYKNRLGDPINHGTWVPMTLKPHQTTEYRSASLSDDATDFLVRIRRGIPPNLTPSTH